MPEMTKIGAVILTPDKTKILVVRKRGKETFIIPGGRPEGQETDHEALAREIREELSVGMHLNAQLGQYVEPAEFDDATLTMRVYDVDMVGEPVPDNEIVELRWVGADYEREGVKLGSTLTRHVIPALLARGDLR
ncbi:NUDIX hydrolase [Actinopolymorpha cephalotaxi]|uniref:8-oxo-dGTP diphosphatase n=1 Tax=Actinopolymorpha cephalotaxi TaxID=504797 RepID=A0ABX2S6Z9_9ACTN|nr:NUDIX domain-containing protein [Actinopolymorpha cephalotaxi]NYH85418.1 8-oxo-dGTP diphosphatase [Actinopolymorpha cephalotaxi]